MDDNLFKQKGLMTEAVKAVIDYGFSELKLNRIEALVGVENAASLRLIEKNNFKREGLLRRHVYIAGEYGDTALFSLLFDEYRP